MGLNLSAGIAHRQRCGGDARGAHDPANKIMRYLNNSERDRTQNRIALLLIALCATLS